MVTTHTIGEAAKRAGLPASAIRFYESRGLLPVPNRTEAGYRLYTSIDVRRLRLIHRARLLGLPLAAVKVLVEQAFTSECGQFAGQLLGSIAKQRAAIGQRIAELVALRDELDTIEAHVRHGQMRATPGQRVAECAYCPLIDQEGGDDDMTDKKRVEIPLTPVTKQPTSVWPCPCGCCGLCCT